MSSNAFSDALYSVQSQWLYSECTGEPDLIVGSSNIFETIPFSTLVSSGPGYCGSEWLQDCSYPGICAAILDTDLTSGYKSFQDSYLYFVPESPTEWLFPVGAIGKMYCQISNMNETALILAGSKACHNSFGCSGDSNIVYYNDSSCQLDLASYSVRTSASSVYVNHNLYNLSVFRVTLGTEKITWTTYINTNGSVLLYPEPLWQLGFLLNISENMVAFYAYGLGQVNGGYYTVLYGLGSGFNVAMNGICLMEIVFQKKLHRAILAGLLVVIYVLFGLPYAVSIVFESYCSSGFCVWLGSYFNTISYPLWQIFCFAFDPITAGTIIFYIIRKSLNELDEDIISLFYIMFNDYQLVSIALISLLNFGSSVFLQLATTYTFFARNDKIMTVYQIFFSLQHTINSACTLWYYTYFPLVLARMKTLRKSMKNRKSVVSEKTRRMHDSVVSSTQKII
ncbi:hypothetical protein HDV06_002778 [Boothiomyces sp. JEL0866]|nr:hypothetical protein HDV06_002778 [Boothiomyces sp. JEL0866]